jgi:hypothetical protein
LKEYNRARKKWLLGKSELLAKTTYRQVVFEKIFESMDYALKSQVKAQNVLSRSVNVTTNDLGAQDRLILRGEIQ